MSLILFRNWVSSDVCRSSYFTSYSIYYSCSQKPFIWAQKRLEWDNITLRHAAAEATGLPGNSVDLVSCCLVMHELPQQVSAFGFWYLDKIGYNLNYRLKISYLISGCLSMHRLPLLQASSVSYFRTMQKAIP